MSYILYNPTPERINYNNPINYNNLNANKRWAEHTYNLIILKHIETTTPDVREKIQATKEILVCKKKISWWERHPKFIEKDALYVRKLGYGI